MVDEIPSFNLVDNPWIRVRDESGEVRELSLLGLFDQASHLRCLANDLPTQDLAILRVLLAILQRAISPDLDEEDDPSEVWGRLWNATKLPVDDIKAYLEQWYRNFDLFDPQYPFMQVADLRACNGRALEPKKLVADIPDGDALFSMRSEKSTDALTYAEAARWLVHVHAFDTAGIKSGVVGDPRVKNGKSYPIGVGWVGGVGGLYLEGQDFRETLLLNLILWDEDDDELFSAADLPAWEKPLHTFGSDGEVPSGRADLYTWQSRRVRFEVTPPLVTGVVLTNGDKLSVQNMHKLEPMTAWKRSKPQEKKMRISPVYMPVMHRSNRALWRGLSSVFARMDAEESHMHLSPGIVTWGEYLCSQNGGRHLHPTYRLRLHATGFEYGTQSSIVTELIDDKLELNAFLLSSEGERLIGMACDCVCETDEAVAALGKLGSNICRASGGALEQANGLRDALRARAYFELDQTFRLWLAGLTVSSDPVSARTVWRQRARDIILNIALEMTSEASPAAVVGTQIKDGKGKPIWMTVAKALAFCQSSVKKCLPLEDDDLVEAKEE